MNGKHYLQVAAALLLAGCATAPMGPVRGGAGAPSAFPGFDTSIYPGEAALQAWRASAPYQWIGYYLPAPCHRERSWVGTRPALERLGWGIAVLYVGQQAFEGVQRPNDPNAPVICSRTLLTEDQGRLDAADAVQKARTEGFAPGSVVFLDVEPVQQIPPELMTYYRTWVSELLRDGRYVPGTYAHRTNASALFAAAEQAFRQAGRSETPPFWIAGGSGFALDQRPFGSGFPFATVWQGVQDVTRTWAGVSLVVDENVASRRSPSAPLQP